MTAADELDQARALAIDACGRIAEFWGFTRTMGRAFGLLYLSREPLSQAELQTRLGISAGSASMTLAALGRWGVVHKIWVRGQRREHYQAETDFWKMISKVFDERERLIAESVRDRLERATAVLRAAPDSPAIATSIDRINRLLAFVMVGQTALDGFIRSRRVDFTRFGDRVRFPLRASQRRKSS